MKTISAIAIALVLLCSQALYAEVQVETVLEGLTNPSGVAIQPETGHLFVADSGASRVIRVVDGKAEDVVTGFPKDIYGKGPMYDIGPLGLAFLDKDTLVVGDGSLPDGEEMLRVYTIPAAGSPAIACDQMNASFTLPETEDLKGEGNFYALAVTKNAIFATSNGDDTKGWVARAEIEGNNVLNFERFLATKEAVEVDAPVGIAISPRGELVVGQMGEINIPHDSLLTFYEASSGKLLLNLPTGLYDITAVAYSPKGQLYALDFAWMDTTAGGLFQLIAQRADGKQTLKAEKIVALDKPTAMTFDKDGALYITVFGTSAEGDTVKSGKLLKIAPGL
jgi:DNA-binding beta-propeller fold protein YncE